MTRAEAKKKRRKRAARQTVAWAIVMACELLAAALPAAVAAAILFPAAYAERGYSAFGSEHALVALVFCVTYNIIHKRVCKKIFE